MKLYRYGLTRWVRVFDGQGAARYGARFNPVGIPALYCCSNPSLPVLECLASNLDRSDWPQYFLACFIYDDTNADLRSFKQHELPVDWDERSHSVDVRNWGGREIKNRDGIIVPSRVNPLDLTVILNPGRPGFGSRITLESVEQLVLDDRILEMIASS